MKIPAAIWKRLGELPAGLREAYNDTYEMKLESYVEEQRLITKSAFMLLLSLHESLEQKDFLHALSFCSDDRITVSAEDLLDLCFGFLVLDSEQNVYRFAHLSVREFLETKSDYSPESSHALAAQFCLRYLCTSNDSGPYLIPRDTFTNSRLVTEDKDVSNIDLRYNGRVMSWRIPPFAMPPFSSYDPFLDKVQEYTCRYWANHTAGSRRFRFAQPLNTMLRNFVMDESQLVSPWFMYWNRLAINVSNQWPWWPNKFKDMTHVPADYLFAASLWSFNDLLELRLRSKPDPLLLRSGETKSNALQLACLYGILDTVKFLLDWDWGLQVDDDRTLLGLAMDGLSQSRSRSSSNPDIDEKYIETIKILLSCGADPNEKTAITEYYSRFSSDIPILKAISIGSIELVKVLLQHGANADVEDDWGLKASHIAALGDQPEIAGLLLATSTDADDSTRTFFKEVLRIH